MQLKPFACIVTICKDDFSGFVRTLKSIGLLRHDVQLICVIRCADDLKHLYEAEIAHFPFKLSIFNEDRSMYNAMNLALCVKSPDLPYVFLNAGDFFPSSSLQLFRSSVKKIKTYELFCFNTLIVDSEKIRGFEFDCDAMVNEKRARRRESKSKILYFFQKIFMLPGHQSIIYGSGFSFLRFSEVSRYSSDIFYNSDAFNISKSRCYYACILSCFDNGGVSTILPPYERLKDRLKVIKLNPCYLFDRRILFGTIRLLLKVLLQSFLR